MSEDIDREAREAAAEMACPHKDGVVWLNHLLPWIKKGDATHLIHSGVTHVLPLATLLAARTRRDLAEGARHAQTEIARLKLDNLRMRERLQASAECRCTSRMLAWSRADIRRGLECTPEDRCTPCRNRAFLAQMKAYVS